MRFLSLCFLALPAIAGAQRSDVRMRARDLGVAPGIFQPGRWNAITDVAGVRVGQSSETVEAIPLDSVRSILARYRVSAR